MKQHPPESVGKRDIKITDHFQPTSKNVSEDPKQKKEPLKDTTNVRRQENHGTPKSSRPIQGKKRAGPSITNELTSKRSKAMNLTHKVESKVPPKDELISEVHRGCLSPENNEYSLEAAVLSDHTAFCRLAGSTLLRLLSTMSKEQFLKSYALIDCRYPYEYKGGHIRHAVNIFEPSDAEIFFFPLFGEIHTKIPIFYCEFSEKRGPQIAEHLRNYDRAKHDHPYFKYKEMYVLHGGYSELYNNGHASEFCGGYIKMKDKRYSDELVKYRHHKRRRTARLAEEKGRIQCRGTKLHFES